MADKPLISIVMPVYNPPLAMLERQFNRFRVSFIHTGSYASPTMHRQKVRATTTRQAC